MRRLNNSKYKELSIDMSTYANYKTTKCRFMDSEYGEWWAIPSNVIGLKCVHPKRYAASRNKPRIPLETVIKKVREVYGDTVALDEKTYKGVCKTCRFVDKNYGEFFTSPRHVFNGHGHRKRGILKFSESQRLPVGEVIRNLIKVHGNTIKIVPETYVSTGRKATFIHKKHGEWEATPNNVICNGSSHPKGSAEKGKLTSIAKYGAEYPSQNREIFNKIQKSSWKTISLEHWLTKEEVLCRGSYEYAVVNVLNKRKIDYDWQIRFELSGDTIYFCDLYLKKDNKYIEIKGRFWSIRNKNKWEIFHKTHRNSALWQEEHIKKLTGLSIYKIKKQFNEARKLNGK